MSERSEILNRLAPLALLLLLAAAVLLPIDAGLPLANADASAAQRMTEGLDTLPDSPTVLVGFDPDLGTYAEIRPTVRTLLADLLERDARLDFISLTPEGRALAVTELERLAASGVNEERLVDLGFIPGAEAALVSVADALMAGEPALGPGGMEDEAPALALVIGGNDLGPRSWVEQVQARVSDLRIAAVVPTSLIPEAQPYVDGGQLTALIATPRDGATYREAAEVGDFASVAETGGPSVVAVLVGMLAALVVLGAGVVSRLGELGRGSGAGEAS
ncbi:MAG TPA: hypothetical protein VFW95_07855 [Candidatus Limnocylindria bacterium]|nr:hypothetical protein [Candidatus Limnocylindria bacterium]